MTNSGYVYQDTIPQSFNGKTVLDFYVSRHGRTDRETWIRRIRDGQVQRAGKRLDVHDRVTAGDQLHYFRPPWEEPDVPLGFTVLFADDHLLAVDKPAGLPVLPRDVYLEHTLLHQVRLQFGQGAAPVHRLDRGTSGVVLFARTHLARRRLGKAMQTGRVGKSYLARVSGEVGPGTHTVTVPLGPVDHPVTGSVMSVRADGQPARTRYRRVVPGFGGETMVLIGLDSGRPHQIRIHLAYAGHPLIHDPLYNRAGGDPDPAGVPGRIGFALHSWRLRVHHPDSCQLLRITAPLPPDFHQGGPQ